MHCVERAETVDEWARIGARGEETSNNCAVATNGGRSEEHTV
jgi:hypothetical protein